MVDKLTLPELSAAAREAVKPSRVRGVEVLGAIAHGDGDYAEILFAAPDADPRLPDKRVAVGVRLNQPLEQIREVLTRTLRARL
jgi:hypothetical protein